MQVLLHRYCCKARGSAHPGAQDRSLDRLQALTAMQHKRAGWKTQGNMARLQRGCREDSAMPQWSPQQAAPA